MRRLAIATTGGDAPGMNAAVRAAVRTATAKDLSVIGFHRGYEGLLANDFRVLDVREVGGTIHLGGTFLRTSRSEAMNTKEGVSRAAEILGRNDVNGLIVVGGNGSFRAACQLYNASRIPVIGIPASIDNDLSGTDTTIGFDTAVNTAVEAIDKIRDTATSHERVFVVEVMGRHRGFLALEVGLTAGAEIVLIPEIEHDLTSICKRLREGYDRGKKSAIIVMAEGAGDCADIARELEERSGFEIRLTRLGHIQRGGSPTAYSRLLACRMGAASVEFLLDGKIRHMTGLQGSHIVPVDLEYSCTVEKPIDESLYELGHVLSR